MCLCLMACATTSRYEESLDSLVGTPEAKLIGTFGGPAGTFRSDGHVFLVYLSSWLDAFAPLPNYTGSYPNYTKSKFCTTIFDVKDGVVAARAIEGNDCGQELTNRKLPWR